MHYIFSGGSGHYTTYAIDEKDGNFNCLIYKLVINLMLFFCPD